MASIFRLRASITFGCCCHLSLIDLMGVHPVQNKKTWADPWAAIRAVSKDIPDHPYAQIQKNHIQKALDEFASFFGDAGFKYYRHKNLNSRLITSAGTIKQTYLVPQSMWNGVSALEEKAPCLIVDFHGLKGFSARQIVSVLKNKWPGLQHLRISLPGTGGKRDEVYSENIARSLELPSNREKLAENIRPYLFAKIHAALGEKDRAFEWLEKAYEEHDVSLAFMLSDETLVMLHTDQRFNRLLKKINLVK